MPEPKIRYARSSDGTNIAYSTLGEGRPLIFAGHPGNLFTFDHEWRIPRVRRAMEQLAERRMFVRTDPRGIHDLKGIAGPVRVFAVRRSI